MILLVRSIGDGGITDAAVATTPAIWDPMAAEDWAEESDPEEAELAAEVAAEVALKAMIGNEKSGCDQQRGERKRSRVLEPSALIP